MSHWNACIHNRRKRATSVYASQCPKCVRAYNAERHAETYQRRPGAECIHGVPKRSTSATASNCGKCRRIYLNEWQAERRAKLRGEGA